MNNRTLVKIAASDNSFSFKTVSRGFHSPHRFYILRKELLALEQKKYIISTDIHSFAKLSLHNSSQGKPEIEITFSWLSESYDGILSGQKETIRLPFDSFYPHLLTDGPMESKEWNQLSLPCRNLPKIEFQSRSNLHKVISIPTLRGKLGRILDKSFRWIDYHRIVLTDDYEQFSFFFTGYTQYGQGVCGGVILHQNNPDDIKTAYYSIHT